MMEAGKLDRRITIQGKTDSTNDFGEKVPVWGAGIEVWAAVNSKVSGKTTGLEVFQAGQLTAVQLLSFTVRYMAGIAPASHRVVYEGKIFDILNVAEIGRREGLEILAKGTDNG